MIFYFNNIVLWLKNGKTRDLEFKPNKVNIITGDSNTGKTAILQIIDYCFFASKPKISESIINENVEWYGINFVVNDKHYTICRKSLNKAIPSDEYYFSSTGEIPAKPKYNNEKEAIQQIIEIEFGIDRNTVIPFGSSSLKAGSKISMRYFLLFNTISQNIITNDEVFFDKQSESRYKDALTRIFDLAVGIDTIENKLKKEKKDELEEELKRLNRKQSLFSQKKDAFQSELNAIVRQAKEYNLVNEEIDREETLNTLKEIITSLNSTKGLLATSSNSERLQRKKNILERKTRNLHRFKGEYATYKKTTGSTLDSLQPILFLESKKDSLIKTSVFQEIITTLKKELLSIKNAIQSKTPIDMQISDIIEGYNNKLIQIKNDLEQLPQQAKSFNSEKEKFIFIGEVKAKLNLYESTRDENKLEYSSQIEELETKLAGISIDDTTGKKELTIKLLEEVIHDYIKMVGKALENYVNYQPVFDYTNKKLLLRKPKTAHIENVGSSSNHMFLHLFLFLGLHEVVLQNQSPFIPPFLIIDQPSRPYWGDEEKQKENIEHADEYKITAALELLDGFISTRIKDNMAFQMIVFEHIPKRIWERTDMKNIYLVAEFSDGNALIPREMLDN